LDLKPNGGGWTRRLAQWAGALRVVTLLPLRRQLALLATALAALLAIALWLAWSEYRQAHLGDDHLLAAAELRTLSQRLAKSALRSLRGDPESFPQVQASRDGFAAGLARLNKDGGASAAVQALSGGRPSGKPQSCCASSASSPRSLLRRATWSAPTRSCWSAPSACRT